MRWWVAFVSVIILLLNCASMQVAQRKKEIEEMMNPLLGESKENVVLTLGVPTDKRILDGLEVYTYYRSYGVRGGAYVVPGEYVTTGGAKTWEAYDLINVYFKDDIMVKWDGYVQR